MDQFNIFVEEHRPSNMFSAGGCVCRAQEIGGVLDEGVPVEPSALGVHFGVYIKKRGGLHL